MRNINWSVPATFILTIIYFLIPLQVVGWIIGESIKGVFIQMSMSSGDFIWYFLVIFYFVVSIYMASETVDVE